MNAKYIVSRLNEPSTWRGITLILTALGVTVSPEDMIIISTAGESVAGILGIFTKDKK